MNRLFSTFGVGRRRGLPRLAALAAALAAGPVAAAPTAVESCDGLQGLEAAPDSFSVRMVDHPEPESARSVESSATKVPWLYLTPRVASILEDVFEDSTPASADAAKEPEPRPSGESRNEGEAPGSPVAGSLERPVLDLPEAPAFDANSVLPRFQRQMFRTDI